MMLQKDDPTKDGTKKDAKDEPVVIQLRQFPPEC